MKYVQFLDGDRELVAGWINRAKPVLESTPELAVVCGRRRERFPEKSIYNRLTDLEWATPIGPTKSCGGDALMRVEMFRTVGGFDPSIVAGEEPELCQRLRDKGWKIARIDAEMTVHDAAILHLSQWWKRAVRGGYGRWTSRCVSAAKDCSLARFVELPLAFGRSAGRLRSLSQQTL